MQHETVGHHHTRILSEDGGNDVEMREITMHQHALLTSGHVLAAQRIDRPGPNPMRPRFYRRALGVSVIVKLCAQLGHAVHIDAVFARDAEASLQPSVEIIQFDRSRPALKATGIEQPAALGQAEDLGTSFHFIEHVDKTETRAQQPVGLAARRRTLEFIEDQRDVQSTARVEVLEPSLPK